MIKKSIKYIVLVLICVITSLLTTYFSMKSFTNKNEIELGDTGNTLFNSDIVRYDNTQSGISSNHVQGAVDELYTAANNFTTYNTRLQGVETIVGNSTLTTDSQTLTGATNELNSTITSLLNGNIIHGDVLDYYLYGPASSSDSTNGLIMNDTQHSFTVNDGESALIIGSCGGLVGLDWYTLQVIVSVMTADNQYHQNYTSVYTNANNTSYRAGGFSFKITDPGTYHLQTRIIPQSGAVVSISQYNFFRITAIYIILPEGS